MFETLNTLQNFAVQRKFRFFLVALVWPALLGLAGLAHADDAKESTKLVVTFEAMSDVNPDASLRPSPIKVRLYELKDAAAFSDADYFTLDNSDKTVLASDMLAKDEFILRPGESKTIERKSNTQTTSIGVLAGYRDLPNAIWRAVYMLKEAPVAAWYRALIPTNKTVLTIQLQPQGIAISEKP